MSKGLELSVDKIRFWCHSYNPLSTAGRDRPGRLVTNYREGWGCYKLLVNW